MRRWERLLFSMAAAVLAISGGAYFIFKELWVNDDPFAVVNHPWQSHALSLHVLAGPIFIFLTGSIFKSHVLPRIRIGGRRGRRLGWTLVTAIALMTGSGYLLQVGSAGWLRQAALYCHLGSGFAFPAFYLGHLYVHWRGQPSRQGARKGQEAHRQAA